MYIANSYLVGVAVFNIFLGLFVYLKAANKYTGSSFFLITLAIAFWAFGVYFANSGTDYTSVLFWERFLTGSSVFIPFLFHHLVYSFRASYASYRRSWTYFHISALVLFLSLLTTPTMIKSIAIHEWGVEFFIGSLYFLYSIYFIGIMSYGLILLGIQYLKSDSSEKPRILYLLTAITIAVVFGCTVSIILPMSGMCNYNKFGPVGTVAMGLIMAYAIVKHRLMDISVIIRKTVIYSLVTGVVALLMVFVTMLSAHFTEGILGRRTIALALTACLITAVLHPLQLKIQAFVDRHLFRDWSDRPIVREVASGFSHELKSPLAGLSMQAQLTMSELEGFEKEHPSMQKQLSKIKDGLHYILNQAMDAARRIEAVRGVAEPIASQIGPVDVASVIDSGLATFKSRLGQTDVSVRRDLPPDLPPVRSNEKQLEIVFINLVKNALDAMEADNKIQHALVIAGQVENGSVLISVKDTGPGIVDKDLGRIFEPYYSTKGRKGTGMGLYLTHQIIKAHGGSIEVKSEEGKGTEFVVRLPKYSEERAA